MGISISDGADSWTVTPKPLHGPAKVDVGNAGTVMRFLPPLAALAHGEIAFDGDPRSYERPLGPVIKALEELGIEIEHEGRYSLPMVIKAKGFIPGGELVIDASASSQFLSALLLVAPSMKNGITAQHRGGSLPSMPHIEMTVQMLRDYRRGCWFGMACLAALLAPAPTAASSRGMRAWVGRACDLRQWHPTMRR